MQVADRTRTVVTHDAGHPRDQIVPFYETLVPRGYLGWGKSTQLGTGMGLVMGAKLATPDWSAVNIMGDAAFGMVGMDFETAVRARIGIVTIVMNNGLMGGYGEWMPDAVTLHAADRLGGATRPSAPPWAVTPSGWRRRPSFVPRSSARSRQRPTATRRSWK